MCQLVMVATFFFNVTATTEIYTDRHTLSLHDALPISATRLQPRVAVLGRGAAGVYRARSGAAALAIGHRQSRRRRGKIPLSALRKADSGRLLRSVRHDGVGQAFPPAIYSSTFFASTSSGTLPPSTTTLSKSRRS